jgi:hypothetical protein
VTLAADTTDLLARWAQIGLGLRAERGNRDRASRIEKMAADAASEPGGGHFRGGSFVSWLLTERALASIDAANVRATRH